MQKGINKVILVGRLSKDPDIRHQSSGSAIANLNVVTSESWRDKSTGEQKEKAEFHRVALFGKLAEVAGEYLRKGSQVYIEGQLQTRKWQDQQGHDRYTTEVVVQGFNGVMQMLGGKAQGQSSQQQAPAQQRQGGTGQAQQPAQQRQPQQQQRTQNQQYNDQSMYFDDDIPFN